jgi:hypothetical protein
MFSRHTEYCHWSDICFYSAVSRFVCLVKPACDFGEGIIGSKLLVDTGVSLERNIARTLIISATVS